MTKRFNPLFICSLLISIVLGCSLKKDVNITDKEKIIVKLGSKKIEIPFSFTVHEQKIIKRNWRQINFKEMLTINKDNDTILYLPTRIKNDKDGNLYILDPPDYSIKKFNHLGQLVKKYGQYGRGPGEFISTSNFDIDQNFNLVAIDPNLGRCEVFANEIIYSIPLKYQPLNVCWTSGNKFATLQIISPLSNSIIMEYNYITEEDTEFENIFLTEELDDLSLGIIPVLNGEILSSDFQRVVYFPRFMNFFVVFSDEGKIQGAYRYIDPTDMYMSEINSSTEMSLRIPQEYQSYLGVSIVKNKIISLSLKGRREYGYFIADYYSLFEGNYLYSIRLKNIERIGTIHFSENQIFYSNEKNEVRVLSYNFIDD